MISLMTQGKLMKWPYPIKYGEESEVTTDVLVLGGGIAGCWAAISAARKGLKVVIVEKGDTKTGGAGGAGCDHWLNTPNPCSKLSAEDMVGWEMQTKGGYCNGLTRYIAAKESYDTLLELENMGAKIRDTEDEFKGADFRDEKTKFLFAYDYENRVNFRVWGSGTNKALSFKHALHKECERLGVVSYNRTQATSLLTEGGKQGNRVLGATGLNVRTGEFVVFRAKATVLCLSRPQRIWHFSTELTGLSTPRPHTCIGNGHAMAWRAGAELTQMEMSAFLALENQGYPNWHIQCGRYAAHGCNVVDAKGKMVPWVDVNGRELTSFYERCVPAAGQKFLAERATDYEHARPDLIRDLPERVRRGEYTLPFFVDFPSLEEKERRAIWGLMIGQEGKTRGNTYDPYRRSGFDPERHQHQNYSFMKEEPTDWWRDQPRRFGESGDCGGLLVDWNLMTNLEGLFAAGDQLFGSNYHYHAASTGRYAGRKAADYALGAAQKEYSKKQVQREKDRIYAPIRRKDGVDWKELNAGTAKIMSKYCDSYKSKELMEIGLWVLKEVEEKDCLETFASDPHKLGRTLDVMDIVTVCQIIVRSCLARKASSKFLNFYRVDYPQIDPPEWRKWITLREEEGKVQVGALPIDFWGSLEENYKRFNSDYRGSIG